MELRVVNNENASTYFDSVISKLGNITSLEYVSEKVDGALSYRVKSNEYFIPITGNIDIEAEIANIESKMKSQVEKLKRDESFDVDNCDNLDVYTKCGKAAEETYQKELEKGKSMIEAEKTKCKTMRDNIDKIMDKEEIIINERVEGCINSEN